jgi:prepilin-type N-terminal cleavage/methylation domain-containing protein
MIGKMKNMITKHGFTLIEILVAIAITSAALITMMIAWINIQRMSVNEGSFAQVARLRGQILMEDVIDDVIRGQSISFDSNEALNQ